MLFMIHHRLSKPKRLALATQWQQASWTQVLIMLNWDSDFSLLPGKTHGLADPRRGGVWTAREELPQAHEHSWAQSFISYLKVQVCPASAELCPCSQSRLPSTLLAHRYIDSLRSYSLPLRVLVVHYTRNHQPRRGSLWGVWGVAMTKLTLWVWLETQKSVEKFWPGVGKWWLLSKAGACWKLEWDSPFHNLISSVCFCILTKDSETPAFTNCTIPVIMPGESTPLLCILSISLLSQ